MRLRAVRWIAAGVLVLTSAAACSQHKTAARPSASPAPSGASQGPNSGVPSAVPTSGSISPAGLLLPVTYMESCLAIVCATGYGTGGPPAQLWRALHIPTVAAGAACPTTPGEIRPAGRPFAGLIALAGSGPVRPLLVEDSTDARRGVLHLGAPSSAGWYQTKTLWFAEPSYTGPILMRATSINSAGPIGIGGGDQIPVAGQIAIAPGPSVNEESGARNWPGSTWVKAAGCYAIQVDGLDFSDVFVVRAELPK